MRTKTCIGFCLVFVASLSIAFMIGSVFIEKHVHEPDDISSQEIFNQLINTNNTFLMFYTKGEGRSELLDENWKFLRNFVANDFQDIHVSKFDCSAFGPICRGIGVEKYPALVWMQDGSILKKYEGTHDIYSLKAFVVEMSQKMKSMNWISSTTVATEKELHVSDENLFDDNFTEQKTTGIEVKVLTETSSTTAKIESTTNIINVVKTSTESSTTLKASTVAELSTKSERAFESSTQESSKHESSTHESSKHESSTHESTTASADEGATEKAISTQTENDETSTTKAVIRSKRDLPRLNSNITEVSAKNFTESLNCQGVTLLLMYAGWCHASSNVRKALEQIAVKHSNDPRIKIIQMDCEKESNDERCYEENLVGFPTINLYKYGEALVNDFYSEASVERLEDLISSYLSEDEKGSRLRETNCFRLKNLAKKN